MKRQARFPLLALTGKQEYCRDFGEFCSYVVLFGCVSGAHVFFVRTETPIWNFLASSIAVDPFPLTGLSSEVFRVSVARTRPSGGSPLPPSRKGPFSSKLFRLRTSPLPGHASRCRPFRRAKFQVDQHVQRLSLSLLTRFAPSSFFGRKTPARPSCHSTSAAS